MANPGRAATNVNVLQEDGVSEVVNSITITTLERDPDGYILRCRGTSVPTDGSSGYAKGCLFLKTNAASGDAGVYRNVGTTTSSLFEDTSYAVSTITLTAAQVNALQTTVATLVSAVANKTILVDNVYFASTVTSATTGGSVALEVVTGSSSAQILQGISCLNSVNILSVTGVASRGHGDFTSAGANLVGSPISLWATGKVSDGTGAVALTVVTRYRLV